MNPIDFKESNMNLQAGNNPSTEDMRVCIAANKEMTEGKNIVFAVSAWKPTEEELAEISRTGIVYLSVMGWPVPPISIMGFNPFEVHGYEALVRKETAKGAVYLEEGQSYCLACGAITKEGIMFCGSCD